MADFQTVSMKDPNVNPNLPDSAQGPGGSAETSKRMLGANGALATGRGSWVRSRGLWKTFMLYINDRKTAVAGGVVVIEACMELASAPDDPDVDTQVVLLATLNSGTLSFSLEEPWKYLRARVTTADINALQVGFVEQGS